MRTGVPRTEESLPGIPRYNRQEAENGMEEGPPHHPGPLSCFSSTNSETGDHRGPPGPGAVGRAGLPTGAGLVVGQSYPHPGRRAGGRGRVIPVLEQEEYTGQSYSWFWSRGRATREGDEGRCGRR